MTKYDLIVVGGGVMGTFCAYHALRKGKSVLLLEKDAQPYEASFRNFGQVVPSGQALDEWFDYGRKSLEIYGSIQAVTDISMVQKGSWYYASDEDELMLLEEIAVLFAERNYPCSLHTAAECLVLNPSLNKDYVKGGLFCSAEASVNPLVLTHRLRSFLIEHLGLHYQSLSAVNGITQQNGINKVSTALNQHYFADKVIIANGKDTQFLFPEHYPSEELKISKLQMLRLAPQRNVFEANVLTGLTIRRYDSFKSCPSFSSINTSAEQQLLQRYGIHILFKQAQDGSIILGDSHEYVPAHHQADFGFELNTTINELMLNEAKRIAHLDNWQVSASWAGFYMQGTNTEVFTKTIDESIHIVNGIGGKGMTTSAGFTASFIEQCYQQ